ncbi:pyroglutamyl peptidase family protein, partial [Vibrio parahaemolyticus V-223/04]
RMRIFRLCQSSVLLKRCMRVASLVRFLIARGLLCATTCFMVCSII